MKKTLRSTLSAALALALLFSLALSAGAAPAREDLKILVASDIHYRPLDSMGPLPPAGSRSENPILSMFPHGHTTGKMHYETEAILDEFFRKAGASGAQYLLIPGDVSDGGHWDEHRGIAKKLRDFQRRSGIQVFVIPGNHDIRTASQGKLELKDFLKIYADLGYDKALARREGDASYTAELGQGYRLLAVDAMVYGEDKSRITPELFDWIEAQLEQAHKDGKNVIFMTHGSVLEHFMIEGFTSGLLCIDQHRRLSTMLADAGVKYAFTGHQHANDISHAVTKAGNKLFDIETGSLITHPAAWREVTFSDNAVEIKTRYVESIDPSLLPEGFSKEQIKRMREDFTAYSFDFMRAGFQKYGDEIAWITDKLAGPLKIPAGGLAYEVIDAMVGALQQAVRLPMYGKTGSVEEIARRGGVELEPSEYYNLLDLAGAVYAGHFAGNENVSMDSLELRLFGQAVNAVLLAVLTEMPVQATDALLAAVGLPGLRLPRPDVLLTLGARRIYRQTAAKHITRELVRTLGEGIFTDWSPPDDLNAALEPYGARWELSGRAVKIAEFPFWLDVIWRLDMVAVNSMRKIVGF